MISSYWSSQVFKSSNSLYKFELVIASELNGGKVRFFLELKIKEKIPDSSIFFKLKNYKNTVFQYFSGETHISIKY